jgi:hypothetical protein
VRIIVFILTITARNPDDRKYAIIHKKTQHNENKRITTKDEQKIAL